MTQAVLVTGARAPVAIDLARAFEAAGQRVTLADSVTAHAARAARVGRGEVLRLPPARHAFAAYADALTRWADEHPGGVIVPTCEEVFYAAQAGASRGFAAQVFAPAPPVLRRLHSKIDFPAWARALGIAAPETVAVVSAQQAMELASGAAGHLVLKPEFSRFGTRTRIGPQPGQLTDLLAGPQARWAAQPFIEGEEICLWTAARDGEIVASVAYRPRWRLGGSASFGFEAMACPAALDMARTLAAAERITGHLAFDIIVRPDGEVVPIECNPRAVSGLHFFGGDPALARALLGQGPAVHGDQGLAHVGPAMWLLGLPHALRKGRLGQWRHDMRHGRDVLADRTVAFGALRDALQFAWTGWSARRDPQQQTTDDIEWNGETIG